MANFNPNLPQLRLGVPYINGQNGPLYSFQRGDDPLHNPAAPQPAAVLATNPPYPSIWAWAGHWRCETIVPLWAPPPINEHRTSFFLHNTTNPKYGAIQNVANWHVNTQQVLQDFPILARPYNYHHPHLDNRFCPASNPYGSDGPYWHEAGLSGRLDSLLFPDLQRVQRYIAFIQPVVYPVGVPPFKPLFTCSGSDAWRTDFLSDRSALHSDWQVYHRGLCFGDIKPSYKFQARWNIAAFNTPAYNEYRKVLSQVSHYLNTCGAHGNRAARYGYVITDQEVILLRRRLGAPNAMDTTIGFPLQENPHAGQLSGMQALIYIHLLAGSPGGLM